MKIEILKNEVNKEFLKEFAKEQFGNMVKAVVDIETEIVVIRGYFKRGLFWYYYS